MVSSGKRKKGNTTYRKQKWEEILAETCDNANQITEILKLRTCLDFFRELDDFLKGKAAAYRESFDEEGAERR